MTPTDVMDTNTPGTNLAHALERHRRGERSLSELADETGFAIEGLMDAVTAAGRIPEDAATDEMMVRKSVEALFSPSSGRRASRGRE